VIALKPILQPSPVMAQGNVSGVQFSSDMSGGYWFFDAHTGDLWHYIDNGDVATVKRHYRIAKLGESFRPIH
jgi:hypothetical protein